MIPTGLRHPSLSYIDNGFNFDGYAKGKANFVFPVGWSIDLEFSNKSATPHDMALTASLKTPAVAVPAPGGQSPVAIPGAATLTHGLSASDGTVVAGFAAVVLIAQRPHFDAC